MRRAAPAGTVPGVADQGAGPSVYELAGGMEFFERLVDRFYEGVAGDPVLLPLYPEADDLGPARRRLTLFLVQYWGGPTTYSDERGHPRLRMRHAPFAIGPRERDHWLRHMRAALESLEPPAEVAEAMAAYFGTAAEAMRNRTGFEDRDPIWRGGAAGEGGEPA
jgi:hemoglobin